MFDGILPYVDCLGGCKRVEDVAILHTDPKILKSIRMLRETSTTHQTYTGDGVDEALLSRRGESGESGERNRFMVRTRRRNTHWERNANLPPKPAFSASVSRHLIFFLIYIIDVLLFASTLTLRGSSRSLHASLFGGMFWSSPIQEPSLVS